MSQLDWVPARVDEQSAPQTQGGSHRARDPSRFRRVLGLSLVRQARARGALMCVLLLQAALTLRNDNTAFQDEATYLFSGHRLIDLWLHGTPTYDGYAGYFSGAPFLYPVLAASADDIVGLQGVRTLSLVFALGSTLLLYLTAKRLYDRNVALVGAALFAVAEPTLFMGNFATYDAAALFLLAFATWIGVKAARSVFAFLLVAPILALAGFTKYAVVLYIPAAIAFCALAVARERGLFRAVVSAILLTASTVGLVVAGFAVWPELWVGVQTTTVNRDVRPDSPWAVADDAAAYIGIVVILAVVGAAIYCRRIPPAPLAPSARYTRVLLAIVSIAAALAAPANQIYIHTLQSLHKHVGFGLWFVAPMAAVAVAQLLRQISFRGIAAAVVICTVVAWTGMAETDARFHDWPNSDGLVSALRTVIRPVTGRYLVEEHEVPRYYLRRVTEPYQWIGTSAFTFKAAGGPELSGLPAYQAAIKDGYFDAVALRYGPTRELDLRLADVLNSNDRYELVATAPLETSFGEGRWDLWRRN